MKIAILHYAAPPVVGGVESVIGWHARLLAEHGHSVSLIAGRGAKTQADIEFSSFPLADSRHPQVLAVKASLDAGRLPSEFHPLVQEISQGLSERLRGFDILIAHNVCSLNKNLALTAALYELSTLPGFPHLILWHHDLAWTAPRYQAELHPGFPWDLLRTDWPHAIQVVVSEFRRKELAQLLSISPERIHTVPNGIEPATFLGLSPLTRSFVEKLNLLASDPLLLLPVRITSRKNIEFAIQVMASLCLSYPQARLVISGPLGPHNPANLEYFNRLTRLRAELALENAVIFLAEIHPEYLPDLVITDFYRLADALLFPSQEEGFGIPILEAGLAGIPIFCSDIPPLSELAGGLAETFSLESPPHEVARRIVQRLASSPQYALRRRVIQKFTWQNVFKYHIHPLLAQFE